MDFNRKSNKIYGIIYKIYWNIYKIYGKWLGMVGNGWEMVGIIQPMCSAPGAFPPGVFFRQKSAPFNKKCIFCGFYNKIDKHMQNISNNIQK